MSISCRFIAVLSRSPSVARQGHQESDAGTTRCRQRPLSDGVLSEYDLARTEHPPLAIRNHPFEFALKHDDPSSGRCYVPFLGASVALLAHVLDEQDARRAERPRELERRQPVGDMLPLEIELDITWWARWVSNPRLSCLVSGTLGC